MELNMMKFEEGWLLRQCKRAADEVATWPDWKKAGFRIVESEPMSDREATMRYYDARKYGNY